MDALTTATALWGAVVASGLYHGINPGMGWPLAVSAALMDRTPGALFRALVALALGHLVAMVAVLFPFAVLMFLVDWQRQIQIGAACLVIGLGIYLLINRRHPRFLARVPPSRLALWSFLAAMAHGAGLMLVPIYLGICQTLDSDAGHAAAATLMQGNLAVAASVAVAHTLAMTLAGGALALGVYHWLGLKFLSRSWFNLDVVWALSLILVGGLSLLLPH
ncbi:conserved hypothetical protein [Dinoroseobacter shibae DFL 12 = DSM 16493]|uniref:Arginine/ornithine antiporter ArcD n=1 Tax=Dinoroseobacter shibae (strain DSM 16493 / NCIMB 14021 / DFL 12) TaxID=398580 RepID=A8LQV8_DINSH|nr:hypothetical protein [Dinoroseobacter shibae]ABV92501.1 conserved hypothetical protein [Dinoroseobacter shibae DFL 12 = DSM 16493]URF47445.1 hypothetical protein M8008_03910 [Dinoroseobacter shibae]URF51756.1 hypothetical protein M8007_03910 [Dinoroseobacter shibae]